jgi:hypothetical protein
MYTCFNMCIFLYIHLRKCVYIDLYRYICIDTLIYMYISVCINMHIKVNLESMEERKYRQINDRLIKLRCKQHATWAIDENIIKILINYINDNNILIKQKTIICFSKIINAYNNKDNIKNIIQVCLNRYVSIVNIERRVVELNDDEEDEICENEDFGVYTHPSIGNTCLYICTYRCIHEYACIYIFL